MHKSTGPITTEGGSFLFSIVNQQNRKFKSNLQILFGTLASLDGGKDQEDTTLARFESVHL